MQQNMSGFRARYIFKQTKQITLPVTSLVFKMEIQIIFGTRGRCKRRGMWDNQSCIIWIEPLNKIIHKENINKINYQ